MSFTYDLDWQERDQLKRDREEILSDLGFTAPSDDEGVEESEDE